MAFTTAVTLFFACLTTMLTQAPADAGGALRAEHLVSPGDGGAAVQALLTRGPLDAPGPRAQVKAPRPEVTPSGRLSPEALSDAVAPALARVQRCFETALTRDRPDTGGVLLVDFTLGAKGAVVAASSTVREGVFSKELRACVVAAFERVVTKPPAGAVRVRYPLTFLNP